MAAPPPTTTACVRPRAFSSRLLHPSPPPSLTVDRVKSNVAAALAGPFVSSLTLLPPADTPPPGVAVTSSPGNEAASDAPSGAAGMAADARVTLALVRRMSKVEALEPA